jgi:transcriptional regulator with XRE-family HTH domain
MGPTMLGRSICSLRNKRSISREDFVAGLGISAEYLRQIEEGAIPPPIDNKIAFMIADRFKFRQSQDYLSFISLNRRRRFKAYVVGLPKTGTVSLCGIFGNYWADHEFNQWDTHQMIRKYEDNLISFAEYQDYVMKRDGMSGYLELDSAHFNRHYMDIIAGAYPKARFIFLVRDCFSWVDSFINYFTEPNKEAIQSSPEWNGLPFDLPRGDNAAKKELIANFIQYIDIPLAFWAAENLKMIEKCRRLSNDRFLIIKTNEIHDKTDEIAGLVGIDPGTLIKERSHLNKASYHVNILKRLDSQFLEEKFDFHCSSLMNEFFPGYTLKDFLSQ